jgi:hypothetical protein
MEEQLKRHASLSDSVRGRARIPVKRERLYLLFVNSVDYIESRSTMAQSSRCNSPAAHAHAASPSISICA